MRRRTILTQALAGVVLRASAKEDVPGYLQRVHAGFHRAAYCRILGAANEFKEGDEAAGVAAANESERTAARALIANTRLSYVVAHPPFEDSLSEYIAGAVDPAAARKIEGWTFGELKAFLLREPEEKIQPILPGLASDVISTVVKLFSNAELRALGAKVFHPLPGSKVGAKGYMGARIQPNSPTDDPEDIAWQVFNGFSFAVGDVVLGANPVSSQVESVATVERTLLDIVLTFGLEDVLPHCVLAHIDVQAEAEKRAPGTTGVWFQSLAGVADANATFDISVEKMRAHARSRTGRWALYFETGQGADATNGHAKGFDMVMHESRKYGFARALRGEVPGRPWVHVNDVAGFIGPEVFRTREQLVRCCLEDIAMGKLHGLTIGLDICSTLHMDVDLDDLDWCIREIMPANPAYLMALPTKNDPMLSYLTTAFADHVRIRDEFGYKVDDRMWRFFQDLGVIDRAGRPTSSFGHPDAVYLAYRRRKGDGRPDSEIRAEARAAMDRVRKRGVFLAEGSDPELDREVRRLYADSKRCIHAELPRDFEASIDSATALRTQSADRADYILHPPTGEQLAASSEALVTRIAQDRGDSYDAQLVISDGLNALALTDDGHLEPFLTAIRAEMKRAGWKLAPGAFVVRAGRVRAGYRIGELLFGKSGPRDVRRALLHVIGERPGSGHHAFSVYLTAAQVSVWAETGRVDHDRTHVVSGIADTALGPARAAREVAGIVSSGQKAGTLRPRALTL